MQQLYTEHVLPRDLLELWNNGLGNLSHVICADRDKDEEKTRMTRMRLCTRWHPATDTVGFSAPLW